MTNKQASQNQQLHKNIMPDSRTLTCVQQYPANDTKIIPNVWLSLPEQFHSISYYYASDSSGHITWVCLEHLQACYSRPLWPDTLPVSDTELSPVIFPDLEEVLLAG